MMRFKLLKVVFAIAWTWGASVAVGQTRSPVMEFSSVLTSLDVYHQDGRLALEDDNAALSTVFLPAGAKVEVAISKAGSSRPLHVQPMTIAGGTKVFHRIEARGRHREFKFTQSGKYVATYRANGRPMTVVPFTVEFEQNDDEFDPKTHAYLSGPWSEWAYLFASVARGGDADIEVRFWVRKKSFLANPPADRYTAELRKSGDVIAVSDGGSSNSKRWQFLRLTLKRPESKGGGNFKWQELGASDGSYQVAILKNGEPHATYPLEVRDGKPMPHPRQASGYRPRTEYIVPRFPGLLGTLGSDSAGHAIWMKRLSDAEAKAAASSGAARQVKVSEEDKRRWTWLPKRLDPKRPFKLKITDVETRSDTGFAVGEDLIVFGTGFPRGVKYLRVGDTRPREIPGGETYNATVFGVCGEKIILVKRNQVLVFDAATEKLTPIPETEVSLYSPGSKTLVTNGYLVGTVSRATAVTDRTIVKIIDVSGDQPRIIPINNSSYVDSEVSSLAIDAANGVVTVGVARKKLITTAAITPSAKQRVFDLSDYRGVYSNQIFVEDDWVTYADEDWKVRLLDLSDASPRAITDQAFANTANGFVVRKGRLVVATTGEKVGSRYRFAISDLPASPTFAPGTGTAIKGTSGGLGMAGSAAIAIDKTVFIAGNPGDSIGVGEHLQMLREGKWIPLRGADGKVISASTAITSTGLLAFKALNSAGKTVIGYATYGERIDYAPPQTVAARPAAPQATRPLKPIAFEKENIHYTQDEADEAALQAVLENEATMLPPLTQAFGEEKAKQQIIESCIQTFKASGDERLIDEWKRRSQVVAEADKPTSKTGQLPASNADLRSVEAALAGQWRALRTVASGEEMADEQRDTIRLTLAGGVYSLTRDGELETGRYEIDSSVKPYQITLTPGSSKNQSKARHGSFKLLKGKRLMMIVGPKEADPPTAFVSTSNNKTILSAYQKVE